MESSRRKCISSQYSPLAPRAVLKLPFFCAEFWFDIRSGDDDLEIVLT
jgi:hypothetical protein